MPRSETDVTLTEEEMVAEGPNWTKVGYCPEGFEGHRSVALTTGFAVEEE
jgi:hypothetical protein